MVRARIPILKCQRTQYIGNWVPSTVTTGDFWKSYQWVLGFVNNNAEFVNLFDLYRFAALRYVFRPRYNSFAGNDTTDTTLPGISNQAGTMLHILKDPYSVSTPAGTYSAATLNTFLEGGNVKTYTGLRPVSVYFKPVVRMTVAGGSSKPVRSPWLNVTDTTIPHYGFQAFAQDVNLTGVFGQSWDVYVTAYMMFKNLR